MGSYIVNQYDPDYVSPPGGTLRDILEERDISQADLAIRMGRPEKTISEIVHGKTAITPDTSLQLEMVLGVPAKFWNTREQQYREYLARKEQEKTLESYSDWADRFPLKKMVTLGMIPKVKEPASTVRYLLQYLGVNSPSQWEKVYEKCEVSFRKSAKFDVDEYALGAWLRAGVVKAGQMDLETYDPEIFQESLQEARTLTTEDADVFQPALESLCARSGVAVAFVPQLPKSRVSGSARWLSSDHALIQLTIRYKTNDHLWFTFFHEAAHVLLHGKRKIFLDTSDAEGDLEEDANRWASDFLIPPDVFEELATWKVYSKRSIRSLAEDIGIAPGIIVGRLQHEGLLPYSHCNELKVRLSWSQ